MVILQNHTVQISAQLCLPTRQINLADKLYNPESLNCILRPRMCEYFRDNVQIFRFHNIHNVFIERKGDNLVYKC